MSKTPFQQLWDKSGGWISFELLSMLIVTNFMLETITKAMMIQSVNNKITEVVLKLGAFDIILFLLSMYVFINSFIILLKYYKEYKKLKAVN